MTTQSTFTNPNEAMAFIRDCLQLNDPIRLYAAFTQEPNDFWKDHLFQALRQIQETETLKSVFLDDGRITTFPENENRLHLGGHDPRTRYIHIDLEKGQEGWVLKSILVCR
jgi:hypothetical protein